MSKRSLIDAVARAVQDLQDATDVLDERAARRLAINRTDLRCLSRLSRRGPLTASELATAAGLTGGAMTTVIDRLEQAGLAERRRDTADRRRVLVHLTGQAERISAEIWGPVLEDAQVELGRFSLAELAVVERFLALALKNQRDHAERLRHEAPSRGASGRRHGAGAEGAAQTAG
ncbi:MarR family winged helix-turn-helix transcriptional regulator [Nonomuraea gerenzanensis]|uniref:Transcriptional regulator, MarR family n=1 Tax=Nonomuraea gerenzanensis TaxID=93944 RepID=A0A1M4ECW0_9ACTN|nr:MarR family transcriptional regulator [Nonomuraea gerenzanensis]UBU08294.1 MarR family transcriptional regulator [Nonomuraea gerenzanensis]SBO96624.1 Transcriptional regulator, MarR family [Nonomuraea gerenzanensis]